MNPTHIRSVTLGRFAAWGLEPNPHLPLLESVSALCPKTSAEVAARAVAAGYVAAACFGAPMAKVHAELKGQALWQHLSGEEQSFLSTPDPTGQARAFHGWLIESIQFMAWALGHTEIEHLTACGAELAGHFPAPGADAGPFIAGATLRPLDKLLQEADTLYMLHWRAVDNSLVGRDDPRVLLPRVSFRRHAADWVIGAAGAWEDVSLDT